MLFEVSNNNNNNNNNFNHAVTIINDNNKGRCLISNDNYNIGNILFIEKALIYSTNNNVPIHECFNYAYKDGVFTINELNKLEEIIEYLITLNKVNSYDTARNLIELIALYRLKQDNEEYNLLDNEIKDKIILFSQLTSANLNDCINDMKKFRLKYKTIIPNYINDTIAGALLGILNTNQVELESINGSGLFVQLAIAEHNCFPNCSYNTSNDILYLTSIQNIIKNDRISIDYGNYYYDCTPSRLESLYKTYNFICNCNTCKILPDKKRSFLCNICHNINNNNTILEMTTQFNTYGVIHPIGYQCNNSNNSDNSITNLLDVVFHKWQCNTCHRECNLDEISTFVAYEKEIQKYLMSDNNNNNNNEINNSHGIININILNNILSQKIIHCTHYLLFWALEELSMNQIEDINECMYFIDKNNFDEVLKIKNNFIIAFESLNIINSLIGYMLPPVHHEKVICYDKIAQLYVSSISLFPDNINKIKEYFIKAYEHSVLACGNNNPLTIDLLELSRNTPTTIEELQKHYQIKAINSNSNLNFNNINNNDNMEFD